MLPRDAADPKRAFQEQFAALVKASGLSIRDIARRTRVGRSTIHGWQHGKSLPQNLDDLIKVVEILRAAATAAGNRDTWGAQAQWTAQLSEAKQERDTGSYPARRQLRNMARAADLDSERHARTIDATGRAIEAVSGLLYLADKPD